MNSAGGEYGEIDPNNHDWGPWKLDAYEPEAFHRHDCSRPGCNAYETEPHHADKFENTSSEEHTLVCCTCHPEGYAYATEPHTFTNWTDNGDGTHTGTCICGREETEDHKGGEATCKEKAKCEVCGVEYGEPKGHDWSDWTLDPDDATQHKRTCKRGCGTTEYGPHTGGTATCVAKAKCTVCGEEYGSLGGHSFTAYTSDNNATCTQDGTKTALCDNGCGASDTITDEGSMLAHTEVTDPAQPATCTESGLTEGKHCSVCKAVLQEQQTVPALGHSPVADAAVEPTYTETGLTAGSHCRVCGAVLVEQEIVPMLVDPLLIAGEDVTGFVEYQGGIFLVEKGRVLTTANGLVNDPAQPAIWYFLSRGQAQLGYTGLAYYDGEWFYVRGGRLDISLNAFVAYDGGLFLVAAGRVVREASGLIMNPDRSGWYYCANGQAQTQYTGLARYDGRWFYVERGAFRPDFTGEATYNGGRFQVVAGEMACQIFD